MNNQRPDKKSACFTSIVALVLGILSVIAALFFFRIPVAPQLLAATGILLGFIAKNKDNQSDPATIGIIMSIIALIWGWLSYITCFCFGL